VCGVDYLFLFANGFVLLLVTYVPFPSEVLPAVIDRVRRAYPLGPIVHGTSALVALWNAWVGLALCTSLWILWSNLCYRPARSAG
jgi:hypothetical protein